MTVSAIIWNTKPDVSTNSAFFKFLEDSIVTYSASSFRQVESLFEDHSEISTIITIIEPYDTETIHKLGKLKAKKPKLQLFTTFHNGSTKRSRVVQSHDGSVRCRHISVVDLTQKPALDVPQIQENCINSTLVKLSLTQIDIMILLALDKSLGEISQIINIPKNKVRDNIGRIKGILHIRDLQALKTRAKELRLALLTRSSALKTR